MCFPGGLHETPRCISSPLCESQQPQHRFKETCEIFALSFNLPSNNKSILSRISGRRSFPISSVDPADRLLDYRCLTGGRGARTSAGGRCTEPSAHHVVSISDAGVICQIKPQQQQHASVPSAVTTTLPPVLRNVPANGRPGYGSGSRLFASPESAGCLKPRRLEVNAELPSRLGRGVRLLGPCSREQREDSPGGICPREVSGSAVINIRCSSNSGVPGELAQ